MFSARPFFTAVALSLLLYSPAAQVPQNPLQARIDAARPGDVIPVPAGVYRGPLTLRDGIALVGAGAESTTIDGGGADTVVQAGKDNILLGLTVANGKDGIFNNQNGIGIFECTVAGCERSSVLLVRGFAAVANSLVAGSATSSGVASYMCNPYIANSVVSSSQTGVLAMDHSSPTLVGNTFADNAAAVKVSAESRLFREGNAFEGNGGDVVCAGDGPAVDLAVGCTPVADVPPKGSGIESYRRFMKAVSDVKLAEHPVVIYDLRGDLGQIGVMTLFPWATFDVASSSADTGVSSPSARDMRTLAPLRSECFRSQFPSVAVSNDGVLDVESERYLLKCTYSHPPSYFAGENGRRHFVRTTNSTRVEIVFPTGFIPRSLSHPATFEWVGGYLVAKITSAGFKQVELLMEPESASEGDAYGVLGLEGPPRAHPAGSF